MAAEKVPWPINTKPFRVSFVTAFKISLWQNFKYKMFLSAVECALNALTIVQSMLLNGCLPVKA
jgi:hypothetical protein